VKRRGGPRAATDRPLRGAPADTRARLVSAAAVAFNRDGYHGTDSNRIAHAAGYAAGTFYKHFSDKREIFLAAWEAWVDREWEAVSKEMAATDDLDVVAERIVRLTLEHHTRWRGLRASMLALAATDAVVRRFHRAQRRRQLRTLAGLRADRGSRPRPAEQDVLLLFTLERACDSIAQGELTALGLSRDETLRALRNTVRLHLG
jgi:AcrR family transcriptional regulator